MHQVFVRNHNQITIPEDIRKLVHIHVGDPVEIYVTEQNEIILKPLKAIDPNQSWFWTKEWQEKEKEADESIAKGESVGPFENIKTALKCLKKGKGKR